MPIFAAIDIGSNSCRLAIAEVTQQHKLRTLHEDREVTRLGESVFDAGVISPESMANTIKALKRFHKAVQEHVADHVRVVATSATRDALNAEAFRTWVKSATGWNLEVISGLEEGRLIHLGVMAQEPDARKRSLLIDLGGGSCEVTLSDGGRIKEMISLPLGAVRLQQEFLRTDPPSKADIGRLRQFIDRELARLDRKIGKPKVDVVIATSGTAAALAEASHALPAEGAIEKHVHKLVRGRKPAPPAVLDIDTVSVRRLADRLVKMSNVQRAAVPGIGPKRSEIIVGGAQVYAALLERAGLGGFRYSPLGLRDGVLAQMLADADTRASVHRTMESERWEGVLEVCRRYRVDPAKAEPVRKQAEDLFDGLQRIHELPEEYRLWLSSAAMMRDIGKFMNHQGHHRHTQYIIANSEIFGFSPTQRSIVAAVSRYLGKSRPDAMDRTMRLVPVEEHTHVKRAVVLLRLAQAMCGERTGGSLRAKTMVYPKRVLLQLHPARGGAELEIWSLKKEAVYFREVFRRELFVEVA
jgi:exopolyphosphatase / guanosine-5'-triphosphate,3'-diphosphate pyrophosphatase